MDHEELLKDLEIGKIKPYELEKIIVKEIEDWPEANRRAALIRLEFLEKRLGKKFELIRDSYIDNSSEKRGNLTTGIEQKIGGSVTPLGMGGPIKINGQYAKGEFYLPVATNEAALIAGRSRGCKVINNSGGIKTVVTRDAMTRAPIVSAPDIGKAKDVCEEIRKKGEVYRKMKEAAESESRVSRLIDIQPFQLGRIIHIRFNFQTGDSMGMNSATKYSANALRALKEKFQWLKMLSLSGNMCSDKKAAHINTLLGRGKSVETEVEMPVKLVKEVWKVEAEDVVKLNEIKNYQGSGLAGTVTGFNANVANTIAGLFVSTGQDCAQVVGSSTCFTRAEIVGDKLVFGITLPCLEIATTGGGADYGTARECLQILGCYGPGDPPGSNVRKLAEIMAAAATAQDLNLLGAEAHGFELADSHIKLARGK